MSQPPEPGGGVDIAKLLACLPVVLRTMVVI